MVLRPLPKSLIKRVRRAAGKKPESIRGFVLRLENIDPRANDYTEIFSRTPTIDMPGGRVFSLKVGRNYPRIKEVVVKRTHGSREKDLTSNQVVRAVRKSVANHNKEFETKNYYLLNPIAYPFGKEYVLMSKTNKHPVTKIVSSTMKAGESVKYSKKGSPENFIFELSNKTKKPVLELVKELEAAKNLLNERIKGIEGANNFLVVGYKNGKFIFVPLVDLY